MRFRLTHDLPRTCIVAVSGGVDSMVALHWLSQVEDRVRGVVHFHHNTGGFANTCRDLVRARTRELGCDFFFRRLDQDPHKGASLENFWREQRYRFFRQVSTTQGNVPIVVAHNMDDCLEEFVMCTMVRGFWGTIPYRHGPCIRPFRLWKRQDIQAYARKHQIQWLEDPANLEYAHFTRAKIRRLVAPRVKYLNPGVYNIVEKVIREQDKRNGTEPASWETE